MQAKTSGHLEGSRDTHRSRSSIRHSEIPRKHVHVETEYFLGATRHFFTRAWSMFKSVKYCYGERRRMDETRFMVDCATFPAQYDLSVPSSAYEAYNDLLVPPLQKERRNITKHPLGIHL
jgi:hypothetical protein